MVNAEAAMRLIAETIESLNRSGTLEHQLSATEDTVLLGPGSALDSIGFVTFVAEYEDRLQEVTHQEHYLVLNEISNFNINNPSLTAKTLAAYTEQLTNSNA